MSCSHESSSNRKPGDRGRVAASLDAIWPSIVDIRQSNGAYMCSGTLVRRAGTDLDILNSELVLDLREPTSSSSSTSGSSKLKVPERAAVSGQASSPGVVIAWDGDWLSSSATQNGGGIGRPYGATFLKLELVVIVDGSKVSKRTEAVRDDVLVGRSTGQVGDRGDRGGRGGATLRLSCDFAYEIGL